MSTGRRLAKRSILGTRVMVPGYDDLFHVGTIQAVKTNEDLGISSVNNRYSVRMEESNRTFEFTEKDLIGPGFRGVSEVHLREGQKVFVTYNNREIPGKVIRHDYDSQEVLITVDNEEEQTILLKIDDVRLLESRKSARLVNSDTDFSKLADLSISTTLNHQVEKKSRNSSSKAIEVPRSDYVQIAGSRKRRTSENIADDEEVLSECSAALLLMKLSCSPASSSTMQRPNPSLGTSLPVYMDLPSPDDSSSGASSFRSPTPSPPLSSSATDEGIVKDLNSNSSQRKKMILYQCTFPGCQVQKSTQDSIEGHVRKEHLHRPEVLELEEDRDHEEEFYYTEIEINCKSGVSSGYTKSTGGLVDHLDMARPAHEDPSGIPMPKIPNRSYGSKKPYSLMSRSLPNPSISLPMTLAPSQLGSPGKLIVISPPASRSTHSSGSSTTSSSAITHTKSPNRRPRDGKKCRKVYGLEQRDLWCTQCKWKKACARFGSNATEGLSNLSSSMPAVKAIKF